MIDFARVNLAIVEPSLDQSAAIASSGSHVQVHESLDDVEDGSLVIVFCDHVLEHVLDVRALLGVIRKKLNSASGVFVFAVPILERFSEVRSKPFCVNFHVAHVRSFSVTSLAGLFRKAGFDLFELSDSSGRDTGEGVFIATCADGRQGQLPFLGKRGQRLSGLFLPPLLMRLAVNTCRYVFLVVAICVSTLKTPIRRYIGRR